MVQMPLVDPIMFYFEHIQLYSETSEIKLGWLTPLPNNT